MSTRPDKTPFYITTAIAYMNGPPHLGHAYEAILTDVMARFQRLAGREVHFLTGTDEHGEKVLKTADKNGVPVQDFVDGNAAIFKQMAETLTISNDDFIRTTEPRHHKASQAIWQRLQENGDIYLDSYKGWYSVREEGYFTEDELTVVPGTGERLTPNGTEATWVEEDSYFFKLSDYTDKLLAYYEANSGFIQPKERYNEIVSFVKGGLKDLSISRHKDRLPWGIPVPGDADHVMYVWLDALTNYITAIGYPDTSADLYQKFWPAQYHVIGKDITRFHAVYWPAFLMAADLPLPEVIFAHGFINVQGQKMSKSIGNVLSPDDLINTYGVDQTRYVLMRDIPHGQDGNFGHIPAVNRMNADLANGLGNLAQRSLSMMYKNCDQAIPVPGAFTAQDEELLQGLYTKMIPAAMAQVDSFKLHRALEDIWTYVAEANAYIDAQAPWTLRKEDPARMQTVLYVLAEAIRCITIAAQAVVPTSASKLLDQLKIPEDARSFAAVNADHALEGGTAIEQPQGVFPRIALDAEEAA